MSTVEPNDHPGDGALARHREAGETIRDCRSASAPVAARPREAGRDIGRIAQIDEWIGLAAERGGAARGDARADLPDSRRHSGEHPC
ncbi:hypothetical protein OG417_09655 [Actinoallomurus sp. NBC_01490]|uniref:hypothetical protein n=1 Tax=Actinoallomurus sp. NBC_01490 TaxID=2903557 RepID=UPI002E3520D6|nr:hypothetical protein [Actinoallomurus sp. NBC_01490]